MPTTDAPQRPRLKPRPFPLRHRAELPALPAAARVFTCHAEHDFLVPNPRPDLVLDPQTLRMIEVR
jgi:hypothetical protein